jgi:uncharacterized protein (DUF433 family)
MAPALLTRSEAAALSGTTSTTVKKAIDQKIIPTRRRGAQTLVETDDVPVLAMLGVLSHMRLSVKHKRHVREWLHQPDPPSELELAPAVIVRTVQVIDEARRRAERYTRLRDEWIARDPDIKRGEPIIRGTRVGVHTLASRIRHGEPDEVFAQDFPHIPAEAREVAVQYAHANPRRGRPTVAPRPRRSTPRRPRTTRTRA